MEQNSSSRHREDALRTYLKSREGRIWRSKDTAVVLYRAEQLDDLLESLMVAAGLQVIKSWPAYEAEA